MLPTKYKIMRKEKRRYTIRIRPTKEQIKLFNRYLGAYRFVWNWALETTNTWHKEGRKWTWNELSREFTLLRQETSWLQELNFKIVRAAATWDFKHALEAFFRRIRDMKKEKSLKGKARLRKQLGFPKFKSRNKPCTSFLVPESARFEGLYVIFQRRRVRLTRPAPKGVPCKAVRILNRAGKWYASFSVDVDIPEKFIDPKIFGGIDIGLEKWVAESDGTKVAHPRFLKQSLKKLAHWQKKLSRQKKGSNRRKRIKQRVAKLHASVARKRKHFAHFQSKRLAEKYDILGLENHSLAKLYTKKNKLSRNLYDAGHGFLRLFLTYKMLERGKSAIFMPEFYKSTGVCPSCGCDVGKLDLSVRKWQCPVCKNGHDRDFAAAKCIEHEVRKQLKENLVK